MRPILFNIGGLSIHSYGLMMAIAFLVGIFIAICYAKREELKGDIIIDLSVYVIIAAIVGARFLYVAGQWDKYKDNLLDIFMVQKGGLVFLGGLLLSILVVVLYAKRKRIPVLKLLDVLTPGTALGYAITRIGCFLNGCCFGMPTDSPCGIEFPPGSLAYFYYPDQHLHPTQLYSSASMLLAFIILIVLYRFKKFDGQIFYWGLIFYSVYRFAVEFLRFSPMHWLGLTPSQWIVLLTFAIGVYGLVHKRFKSSI
ncbi:MAG: prolipoprotein diacylglyceryl transferase [Candidatus Margulisiibacteriota bacterium]|nr:prolipoprotein diacylglyceryl transferase [Candidatus Margulisiibacteriota bacterium]